MDKKDEAKHVQIFGIRHHSPAGAYYVRDFLDRLDPQIVLIEGPSDFTELIPSLTDSRVVPPVAVMAYTERLPVRTIIYPFAVYSPEYQALLWARDHGRPVRFIDLPSSVFLALEGKNEKNQEEECREARSFIYHQLDLLSGQRGNETFWEYTMEHCRNEEAYKKGAAVFGRCLRELTLSLEGPETILREAYMRTQIGKALEEGILPEKTAVICGAFHGEGLSHGDEMGEEDMEKLPWMESRKTLMPYSYYRLSERSGYGAGNRAPAYYELIWEGMNRRDFFWAGRIYLAKIAGFQRSHGNPVSTAQVIDAFRLAVSLAQMKGYEIPALCDLRDGSRTCMGEGKLSDIALAVADGEMGTAIGSLPKGVSQTSVQSDFYSQLSQLKLEKYRSAVGAELALDLRERLNVKSREAAFLDLNRSFFLHRLAILGNVFPRQQPVKQENATWAERWILQWTPEAEMQLAETVLKGDTIAQAAAFCLKEQADRAGNIGELSGLIKAACFCGLSESVVSVTRALQAMATDTVSVRDIASAAGSLSVVIQYGDIRRLDRQPFIPLLQQMFLRGCLNFPQECACDDQGAASMAQAMDRFHQTVVSHDFLDRDRWIGVLKEISGRDDLNTRLSGLASAILLEMGAMDQEELGRQVERRLSKGIPAQLGAGWFQGLSMKNHYALIARLSLWEKLSQYLDSLDEEEFKRALVFLRRAFADFTSEEKNRIGENLGEIWQVNPVQVSLKVNQQLGKTEEELIKGLEEFDFDDF